MFKLSDLRLPIKFEGNDYFVTLGGLPDTCYLLVTDHNHLYIRLAFHTRVKNVTKVIKTTCLIATLSAYRMNG